MIATLIKYRLLTAFSMFKSSKGLGRGLLLLIAFGALAFALITFSIGIYAFYKMDPVLGGRVLENLTILSFASMFVFILFWGLSFAVYTIFFSHDLPMLLSMPIRHKDIFVFKSMETTFLNSRISIFFLPLLIIYGLAHHAPAPYYVIIVAVTFFMASIPGSLGLILAAVVTRKVPRARLKSMLTIAGSLIGVALWAIMNQFSGRFSSDSADFGSGFMKNTDLSSRAAFNFLPSGWAYKATQASASGEWGISLLYIGVLLICSVVLSYFAYVMTARYYAGGVAEEISAPAASTQAMIDFKTGGSPILAYIKRDLILLSREPGVIMQNMLMLIFLFLFPFISGGKDMLDKISLPLSPVAAIFSAFFGGQIGSRLFTMERLGFWQNLVIPGGRRMTLLSKSIWGLAFTTIGIAIIGIVHLALGKIGEPKTILLMVSFGWTGFAVGTPLGIFFADFKWEHPKRMLKGGGGFIYVLILMICSVAMYGMALLLTSVLSDYVDPSAAIMVLVLGLIAISIAITYMKLTNMECTPDV